MNGPKPVCPHFSMTQPYQPSADDIATICLEQVNLSHEIGGDGPTDRAMKAGYDCQADQGSGKYTYGLAENIAKEPRVLRWRGNEATVFHSDSEAIAAAIVQRWMDSPRHRDNILTSGYRRIGVGASIEESTKYGYVAETVYATQNFSSCD